MLKELVNNGIKHFNEYIIEVCLDVQFDNIYLKTVNFTDNNEIKIGNGLDSMCKNVKFLKGKEDEFYDMAYQNMLLRENYVVDLISSHSGKKTSSDDWEYNLEYLENHYEEIMKIDNVNKIYIDLYIEECTVEKEMGVMPDKRINVERTKPTSY